MIYLDVHYFGGRSDWQTGAYEGRAAMVTRVDPSWWDGGPTGLTLAVPVTSTWTS